jgi:hypothetical protein
MTPGSVQPSTNSAFSALRAASDTLTTVRDTKPSGDPVQSDLDDSPENPSFSLDFPSPSPSSPGNSSQDSPTFSVHSLQRSSSIPTSTGSTLTGAGISPSVDDDESSAEDDPLMARLNNFVSVRDLHNNPGCTLLDFTEYRPIPLANDIENPDTSAHAPVV